MKLKDSKILIAVLMVFVILAVSGCSNAPSNAFDDFEQRLEKSKELSFAAAYEQVYRIGANGKSITTGMLNFVFQDKEKINIVSMENSTITGSFIKNDLGFFACNYLINSTSPKCAWAVERGDLGYPTLDTNAFYKKWVEDGVMKVSKSEGSVVLNGETIKCDLFDFKLDVQNFGPKNLEKLSELIPGLTQDDLGKAADEMKNTLKASERSFCLDNNGIVLSSRVYNKVNITLDSSKEIEQEILITINSLKTNQNIPSERFQLPEGAELV